MMNGLLSSAEMPAESMRVLVADYTRLGTDLIVRALQVHEWFKISVSETGLDRFANEVRQQRPDVVLVGANANGAGTHAIEMVRVARAAIPSCNAVVILEASTQQLVVEAFRAGARGVFCREESIVDLVHCLQCVSQGKVWARNDHLIQLVEALADMDTRLSVLDSKGNAMLSNREMEIVQGVADGLTNKDIARRLQLSEHTIKNYLLRVFDKLGVSNRAELVSYVLHHRSRGRDGVGISAPASRETFHAYLEV